MSPRQHKGRTQLCSKADARTRLKIAHKFLEVSEIVAEEDTPISFNVAVSNVVLAVIAAGDAACCAALGRRSRGQDHKESVGLLKGIKGGEAAAEALAKIIDLKDKSQYGMVPLKKTELKSAFRQAEKVLLFAEKIVKS